MKHLIEHDLDLATAKKVTDRAFAEYKTRFADYDPTLRWVSDTKAEIGFSAKGLHLGGSMQMLKAAIEVELDVPFLLRIFQKRAIEIIDREVRLWIDRAHQGTL